MFFFPISRLMIGLITVCLWSSSLLVGCTGSRHSTGVRVIDSPSTAEPVTGIRSVRESPPR